MKERSGKNRADDEKIGLFFVKEKLVTEAQFNTASDFQRTVGGRVHEVLLRLGFVQSDDREAVFAKYPHLQGDNGSPAKTNSHDPQPGETEAPEAVKEPEAVEDGGSADEEPGTTAEETLEAARKVVTPVAEDAPLVEDLDDSHTGLILDALLRLLIRKGILDGEEIKEEIMRMELEEHSS